VNLAGSTTTGDVITVANGAGVVVNAAAAVAVILGTGGQTFNGSTGADIVTSSGADIITGGTGAVIDTFNFLKANSNAASLATITDYRGTGLGADVINLTDVATVSGTALLIVDLLSELSLAAALNAAALTNLIDNGLSMFVFGGDTYAFVETTGATATYVASDFVVKLTGTTGHLIGDTVAGLGFDGVQ